jgi:hypothetical protein
MELLEEVDVHGMQPVCNHAAADAADAGVLCKDDVQDIHHRRW